jgi:hypothetical protein
MDHPACREPESRRDPRLAGRTAAQITAKVEQFRTGGTVDGPIDATTTEQTAVGGVDDGRR